MKPVTTREILNIPKELLYNINMEQEWVFKDNYNKLEMKLANKDAMIASLIAERKWVREKCCKDCLEYFDGEDCLEYFDDEEDDVPVLIQEWEEGKR